MVSLKNKEIIDKICNDELVYIPPHLISLIKDINKIKKEYLLKENREPSLEEISISLDYKLSIDKIKELIEINKKFDID